MQSTEVLKSMLVTADHGFATMMEGLRDHPVLRPNPGGNHALWTLGHLALIEASVPNILFGEDNPLEHYAALFARGTKPTDNASDYPAFDVLLDQVRSHRAATIRAVDRVGDARLATPPRNLPPGLEQIMSTCAAVFAILPLHQMIHHGQMADVRRAAGLEPLF